MDTSVPSAIVCWPPDTVCWKSWGQGHGVNQRSLLEPRSVPDYTACILHVPVVLIFDRKKAPTDKSDSNHYL